MANGWTLVSVPISFSRLARVDQTSGDAFDEHVFKKGKIYPCVGFPTDSEGNGLHVRVVLRKSQDHPFLYGGPYI